MNDGDRLIKVIQEFEEMLKENEKVLNEVKNAVDGIAKTTLNRIFTMKCPNPNCENLVSTWPIPYWKIIGYHEADGRVMAPGPASYPPSKQLSSHPVCEISVTCDKCGKSWHIMYMP